MDKLAQSKRQTGRGFFNELREKINVPGAFVEGIFKPELNRVMESLKALDDRLRSELTGKKIGVAEAPAIQTSAKDLLKESRTAFNRREYMTGVSDLAMFHKKMQTISNDIDKFFVDVNKIHHKFLFDGMDEEKLKRLREHMEPKAASMIADQLLKEAGLVDSLLNFVTRRGRGLAAWEKKYPKETKALRDGGTKLLDHADTLLANTISIMKEMATSRATRRPDEYMDQANKIKSEFGKFDAAFKAYYQNAITPWMKIKDEIDAANKAKEPVVTPSTPGVPPAGKTELGGEPLPAPPGAAPSGARVAPTAPMTQVPDLPAPAPRTTQMALPFAPPGASPPFAPPPQSAPEDTAPDTERTPTVVVKSHANFYRSLESMSGEDPRVLCGYITKYAKSIQGDDPETAIALFSIVKKLKE